VAIGGAVERVGAVKIDQALVDAQVGEGTTKAGLLAL
jgi:hypothetical protein